VLLLLVVENEVDQLFEGDGQLFGGQGEEFQELR
jgi:hypothetical protein